MVAFYGPSKLLWFLKILWLRMHFH
jgi:hypothetical protein